MSNDAEARRWAGGGGWRPSTSGRGFNFTEPVGAKPSQETFAGMRMLRPGVYTTRASNAQGTVYMGPAAPIYGRSSSMPLVIDEQSAIDYYGQLPKEAQNALEAASKSIGGRTGSSMWSKMVEESIKETSRSGKPVSPLEMFRKLYPGFSVNLGFFKTNPGENVQGFILGTPGQFDSGSGPGSGGGGGSSTQQSIDLSSPTQARGLLMQTMQGVLGRDPNSEEYGNFLKILNESQSGSPQIATASGSTVTRSGGVDAGVVALDYAQSRDDYEDVQNKQYYDMFLNVLAGG
tara:strand:+ start:2221 stop:3090 length:870 start_codon:yes stop_codon:yes gene_type:complete